MKTLLWLDDIRNPLEGDWLRYSPISGPDVIWVKSYDEFIEYITNNGLPDAICFDHDLGEDSLSGFDCAKWLVEYCLDSHKNLPYYNVQSANPVGKENIYSLLNNYKKQYIQLQSIWIG